MDTSTFDLYRVLQSGPYDEAGLSHLKRLLGGQRRLLRGKSDWTTLDQLIQMLQEWAIAAGGGWLSASALAEAAEIAELDLRNATRAEQLRSQAIVTGRAASGLPAAPPVTSEGAIDANAELLHELKTLPPGALTQSFLTDAATEFEEEVRRASSIPARPRTPPAEAARRTSSVPVQRRSVAPAVAAADRTQEVHTIDLELSPAPSALPLSAAEFDGEDVLSAEISRAEQILESDTSPERVRELAELYAKRDADGDREQAAELYTTLAEVVGNPAGIALLERALVLVPDHAEAKALLTRYAVRPRLPITAPRITVLGMQPRAAVPMPPPAAAMAVPPRVTASMAVGQSSAAFAGSASMPPLSAAAAAQRTPASLPPRASVAPPPGRSTLHGNGPANDVLPLHGVPHVVSTPPSVPQISSLTPIVRSDASQLHTQRAPSSRMRFAVTGGLALSAAAAFGLYLSTHTQNNVELAAGSAPNAKPVLTASSNAPQTAAASQPTAAAPEPVAEAKGAQPEQLEARPQVDTPAPLAPPAPSHLPALKFEAAQLRGGKLSEAQLTDALGKAESKFLACYAQASEKKPRMKGRVIYGFTVRTNGRVSNIKRVGGTLRDESLLQCSVKVLETMHFPKPRKQSAQVKLPIQYKRT